MRFRWLQKALNFPARIFLMALSLRLVPVLLLPGLGIGLDDMFQYDMLARSIASGEGYRWYSQEDLHLVEDYLKLDLESVEFDPRGVLTSFRPPLYPCFLALIYLVFGTGPHRFFIVRLVQAVVGAVVVPLVYLLTRRILPRDEKVSRTAAWIVACYPMLVIYPLALATENLFFVLVLASVLVLLRAADTQKWSSYAAAGVLLGLSALTRSVSLAFAGLAVLWTWFILRKRKMAVLLFFMVAAVTLPWMVRNTVLHGKLTGIESALGYDLYVGYHPQSTGTFQYGISLDLMPILDDGLRDEIGQAKALEFIRSDPWRVPYLAVRRLGWFFGLERRALTYFYSNDYFGYIPAPLLLGIAVVVLTPFMMVSLSSVVGLALISWNRKNILVALFMLGYLLPHVLILGEDRFHFALVPFLAIFAAVFWHRGLAGVRSRLQAKNGAIYISLAAIAVLLLLVNWSLELVRDAEMLTRLFGPGGNTLYLPY